MSKIKQAGMLEVSVGGVGFRMRRRSTLVMAQAKGLLAVAGQVSGANAKGKDPTDQEAADFMRSVLEVVLLEVDEGDGWQPAFEVYTMADLEPFSDALFQKFLASGLTVDPTPPSCEA